MVTYRWVIKINDPRTRDQIQPHGKVEAKRDSKALREAVIAEFQASLGQEIPNGPLSIAWLERVDSHGYSQRLIHYFGECEFREKLSGKPLRGRWKNAEMGRTILAGYR